MNCIKYGICLTLTLFLSSCSAPHTIDTPRIPHGWSSGTVTANGIILQYYRTGDGTLTPLVLLHGFTDNGLFWADLAHAFEKDYDVIMYDLRGHGFSDAPQTGYYVDDYVADTVGLVRELKLERPVIIGHSLGGSIAAMLAVEYPDIPQKIVLIDPPGVAQPLFESQDKKDQALDWCKNDIKRLQRMSLERLLKEADYRHPDISKANQIRWADTKAQMKPQIADTIINLTPLRNEWPKLFTPTLIIRADADEETRQKELDAVSAVPNIKIVYIEKTGHIVHMDQPDAALSAIHKFLND
jgi:pimeloyl-ACP methyl ester carboxylesterase